MCHKHIHTLPIMGDLNSKAYDRGLKYGNDICSVFIIKNLVTYILYTLPVIIIWVVYVITIWTVYYLGYKEKCP